MKKGKEYNSRSLTNASIYTMEVSSYISRSGRAELPLEVVKKAKHHILDTLAAVVSGSKLKPGKRVIAFIRTQGGVEEAQVIGSTIITSAINAAFANGIMAHADETDDSHEKSHTHPGAGIVPAALSIAEKEGAEGMRFLKGVVTGYDIACRIIPAIDPKTLREQGRCSHSIGGTFGAAAAAASIIGLDEKQVRYVLDYATQQASGSLYYVRDEEHTEKAFVFSGMPARNGVTAAVLVQSGFTGVLDPFTGDRSFFMGFPKAKIGRFAKGLGCEYEIMNTNIKKYSVGSPIQAPVDALLILMEKHKLTSKDVERIEVQLPNSSSVGTTNDRDMPDINLQYNLAATLLDGYLTFAASHSYDRMKDPAILALKKKVKVSANPELHKIDKTDRQALVEVITKDGTKLREHVTKVRGTSVNPLTTEEVEIKCNDLLIPVLGRERAEKLVDKIWNLEKVRNMRELRPLLSVP